MVCVFFVVNGEGRAFVVGLDSDYASSEVSAVSGELYGIVYLFRLDRNGKSNVVRVFGGFGSL